MEFGFLLKKLITYFIEPFGLILSLFLLGIYLLFIKKDILAKTFLVISFLLLFLFSYSPFSNFLVKNLEDRYTKYNYKHDVKYIHVLGSSHTTDVSQPISSKINHFGTKRILEAVIIHKNIEGSKIIFTGYKGNTEVSNARMNADLAISLGVEEKNIIINGEPKDTKEEANFTKTILDTNESFILVTSASHMPRSMQLFKSLGLNPIPAPTDFHKKSNYTLFGKPELRNLYISQIAMHEYFGMLWNSIKEVIKKI